MYIFTKNDIVMGITSDPNGVPDYEKTYDMPEFQKVSLGDSLVDGIVISKMGIPSCCITKLEFMNRFTLIELASIETMSVSDPIIKVLQRQQTIAEYIDIEDPKTIEGIGYLVSIGLITPERMTTILQVN